MARDVKFSKCLKVCMLAKIWKNLFPATVMRKVRSFSNLIIRLDLSKLPSSNDISNYLQLDREIIESISKQS